MGRGGLGQEVFEISRVDSGWVRRLSNLTGRVGWGGVGSGGVGSGRVGSGRVGSGRVGSGRVGSGHVGSGRVIRPEPGPRGVE